MSKDELVRQICELIDGCGEAERVAVLKYLRRFTRLHPLEEEWGITAEAILGAIARAADITQRGVRGIVAEASFEEFVLPTLRGWVSVAFEGQQPYDFLLRSAETAAEARVQVKLQRREKQTPKFASRLLRQSAASFRGDALYVVEVQKTRTGESKGKKTRPYSFGDFDILAVNMHPSAGDWKCFLYTVGNWLLARPEDTSLVQIMQPVPSQPDDYWTDDLQHCLEWYMGGNSRRLYQA